MPPKIYLWWFLNWLRTTLHFAYFIILSTYSRSNDNSEDANNDTDADKIRYD